MMLKGNTNAEKQINCEYYYFSFNKTQSMHEYKIQTQ